MSGGSYDYTFRKIEFLADDIEERNRGVKSDLRAKFARLLRLCAVAAHDIEWADSGDTARGSEDAAISAALAGECLCHRIPAKTWHLEKCPMREGQCAQI